MDRFAEVVAGSEALDDLAEMTLAAYLEAVCVAYDAVFEKLRPLAPIDKYRQREDE